MSDITTYPFTYTKTLDSSFTSLFSTRALPVAILLITERAGKNIHLPVFSRKGLNCILSQLLPENLASNWPTSRCWLWSSLLWYWQVTATFNHWEPLRRRTMAWTISKFWEATRSLGQADCQVSSPKQDQSVKSGRGGFLLIAQKPTLRVKENEETEGCVPNKRTR